MGVQIDICGLINVEFNLVNCNTGGLRQVVCHVQNALTYRLTYLNHKAVANLVGLDFIRLQLRLGVRCIHSQFF